MPTADAKRGSSDRRESMAEELEAKICQHLRAGRWVPDAADRAAFLMIALSLGYAVLAPEAWMKIATTASALVFAAWPVAGVVRAASAQRAAWNTTLMTSGVALAGAVWQREAKSGVWREPPVAPNAIVPDETVAGAEILHMTPGPPPTMQRMGIVAVVLRTSKEDAGVTEIAFLAPMEVAKSILERYAPGHKSG